MNALASDYRALTLHESVPDGLMAWPVTDDELAPHLLRGELAIVDTTDRRPQHGELYLMRWESGRTRIMQVRRARGSGFWWAGTFDRSAASDGPYELEHLGERLTGRVVGAMRRIKVRMR